MHESKRERYIRILSDKGGADISAEACKELVELLKCNDRPKGEWIDMEGTPTKAEYSMFCSECGRWSEYRTNYCGFCGADMRGGKDGY